MFDRFDYCGVVVLSQLIQTGLVLWVRVLHLLQKPPAKLMWSLVDTPLFYLPSWFPGTVWVIWTFLNVFDKSLISPWELEANKLPCLTNGMFSDERLITILLFNTFLSLYFSLLKGNYTQFLVTIDYVNDPCWTFGTITKNKNTSQFSKKTFLSAEKHSVLLSCFLHRPSILSCLRERIQRCYSHCSGWGKLPAGLLPPAGHFGPRSGSAFQNTICNKTESHKWKRLSKVTARFQTSVW